VTALARLIVLALVVGATSSACSLFTQPCIQPFPTPSFQAVVRVPVPLADGEPALGQCGAWVEYDGVQYTETGSMLRGSPAWTLTEADLAPIGTASGRTSVTPAIVDASVYSMDGVDPSEAIAMRGSVPAGRIVVLVASRSGATLPSSICRYLATGVTASGCQAESS
jgi:hypothetical protein